MRSAVVIGLALAGMLGGGATMAQTAKPAAPLMIFFDWGKTSISRDDIALLDAGTASFMSHAGGKIRIEGVSDRAGSERANLHSSQVRAAAVRDHLIERGVPPSAISMTALGEARTLIPTADGVREPQNRRVDIYFAPAPPR